MKFQIIWSKKSIDQLNKLEQNIKKRIYEKVEQISENPFNYVIKLKGLDLYRLRVGDYRVIMSIKGNKMTIFVLEVGHRSNIYKKY